MGLETGIWDSRLEFGPRDRDLRGGGTEEKEEVIDPFGAAALLPLQLQAQPTQPRGWDLGLLAGIWVSGLEFGPQSWGGVWTDGRFDIPPKFYLPKKEEKEENKEKIPHMCESIDHRPLRGRCPKGLS